MEGIPSGGRRVLKVEREFEAFRKEGELLATVYEAVVPLLRREIPRQDYDREAVTRPRRRATVGA